MSAVRLDEGCNEGSEACADEDCEEDAVHDEKETPLWKIHSEVSGCARLRRAVIDERRI